MSGRAVRRMRTFGAALAGGALVAAGAAVVAQPSVAAEGAAGPKPVWSAAATHDVSPPLSALAARGGPKSVTTTRIEEEKGAPSAPGQAGRGSTRDSALQADVTAATVGPTLANFEGLSNQDNFNLLGFRVNPPDPVGDVGPNHYVEMTNLAVAVYDKTGNLLMGPATLGSLWNGFSVPDCADNAGDPVVLYDQLADRWLLSQFTARGPQYWNCVAVSTTSDPTGAYYRYAFLTQPDPDVPGFTFFPDYPKYGVWTDTYTLTTRDFGEVDEYGISVYGLEKNKMLNGEPARAVQFFLDSNVVPLNLIGDGLLPADIDGKQKPKADAAIPVVGTQDDDYFYGAGFDALNVWDFRVKWRSTPTASLSLATQLPVASFDSNFPCGPTRGCIPQPGITNPDQYVDVLSYRQRPTWRLAYRNIKGYESLVTTQSVEATPGMAGMRWYELRRTAGTYTLQQQGTYAPSDGVHRWMGSIAQDKLGNMALGYSVSNATDVYPGIRYTGRLATDAAGQMTLGEGTVIAGTGVQRTLNSRWGDYTSMNVDPVDDCTFWYVNEYYTAEGQALSTAGWQTRIASFKLPGC